MMVLPSAGPPFRVPIPAPYRRVGAEPCTGTGKGKGKETGPLHFIELLLSDYYIIITSSFPLPVAGQRDREKAQRPNIAFSTLILVGCGNIHEEILSHPEGRKRSAQRAVAKEILFTLYFIKESQREREPGRYG